jgi:16S rRNA (guanine966-N2)-methyltransferase
MKLRIISGIHGGRFITAPRGHTTRPTAARIREAWLSAVGDDILHAKVLDLCSGSGALGIEALSRGARHVHFIEADRRTVSTLERNVAELEIESQSTIVRADALHYLVRNHEMFDVAFADPPYGSSLAKQLLTQFQERAFASQFWIEHDGSDGVSDGASWTRCYGETNVSGHWAASPVHDNEPPQPDLE